VQAVLKEHDIPFIADEVIAGFGRTGSWFATGLYDLKPDIVILAKGITSAYFPLAASVISERLWMVLRDASPEYGSVMHGFTYSGHPAGGGLANLEIMEKKRLVERAAELGPYFLARALLPSSPPGLARPAAHETFCYSAAAASAPRSVFTWCVKPE
jgi:L-2,4-diaminobutyrate transaminase